MAVQARSMPNVLVEVAIPETIEKIRNMVLADRRLKLREIVEAIDIAWFRF